ncbi:hypothetical protein [Streptomyces sp. NPDC014894]|uniref:DUF7224 domain-containing protein n=1 Tax=unclassified Streptomyces TaxID=2593676 RepID=UPI0036FC7D73
MTRVLLYEMRRGEAGKVALLSGVIGVWYLASADAATSDWIGWWGQASVKVQVFGVIVVGSMMSAAAAWTAGRARRTRVSAWSDTAPRSGWSQAVLLWAAAWLWSLLVYAVMTAVAFQRTAGVSEVIAPVWSPLLLAAAMTAFQIAAGVAAGSLLPSRITAPAMGALWYSVFVVSAFFPDLPLVRLFPAVDEHWDSLFQPNTGRLLIAALWCAAAALALLALPALLRRAPLSPGPLAAAPAAVALAAGAALMTLDAPKGEPFWAVRAEQPAEPVCVTEGRTRACLWPDDRHLLHQARTAASTVDRALGSMTGFNRDFAQRGLRLSGPKSVELPVQQPVTDSAAMTHIMLASALPQRPGSCVPHVLAETGGYPDYFMVEAVLFARAKVPTTYFGEQFGEVLERIREAPPAVQDRWLSAAATAVGDCRPVPPLPR